MGTDSLSDYTMLKFAVVLSVVAATYAGPGIDYERCATVSGYWGETVSCAAGSYAVSFCAVQTGSQCNNQYTTLKCCNQKASKETEVASSSSCNRCAISEGRAGVSLECTGSRVVTSTCASGSGNDCGYQISGRAYCCDDHDFDITSQCQWQWAPNGGQLLECAIDQVMVGQCSSGSGRDAQTTSLMVSNVVLSRLTKPFIVLHWSYEINIHMN